MYDTSDRITAGTIMRALDSTGAKIPTTLAAAHERATTLAAATGTLAPPPDALAVAFANAVEHDRDPAADPDVLRVITATALANQGLTQAVTALAYDRFRTVCADQADTIVNAWRRPFDKAAAELVAAHQRLGSVAQDDTTAIVLQGGDAADTWATATAAVKVVEDVIAGWAALAAFTGAVRHHPRHAALRLADIDLTTWRTHDLDHRRLTVWEAVTAGLDLSLPGFDTYRQRVKALEDAQARAAAESLPVDRARSAVAGRTIRRSA